jgi:signal peptidase I
MNSAVASPGAAEPSVFELRRQARRRAWICPGAGFASLGRPFAAAITYVSGAAALVAAIVTAVAPSQDALLTTLALLSIGLVTWFAEIAATYLAWPSGKLVAARYGVKTALLVVLVAVFAVVVGVDYRVLEVGGAGMAPTLKQGERVLYRRGAKTSQLTRGAPVLFRLHADNKFTEAGTLVLGRILAGPDDLLQIRDQMYYVNGQAEHPVAPSDPYPKALVVAGEPGQLLIPKGSYFIVQDSLEAGLDSRVLSYARREDVLSAEFYRLSEFPPLRRIP